MARRFLAVAVAAILAAAGLALAAQSPAEAWTDSVSNQTYYSTHTGTLYIYISGDGHNWGCSIGGLGMDCADAQNVFVYTSFADNTYPYIYPGQTAVQATASFSGQALSVGALGAYTGPYGASCQSPVFYSAGRVGSAYTSGVVCHAQTV